MSIYKLALCPVLLAGIMTPVQASNCYGVIGYGLSQIQEKGRAPLIRTYKDSGEEVTLRVLIEEDGSSKVTQLGIGCNFSPDLAVEVAGWRGFEARVRYRGALTRSKDGQTVMLDVDHHAEADGYELSLVPRFQISTNFALTLRIGVFFASERQWVSLPEYPGYSISTDTRKKRLPVVGAGIRYQVNRETSVALERIGVSSEFGVTTFVLRRTF